MKLMEPNILLIHVQNLILSNILNLILKKSDVMINVQMTYHMDNKINVFNNVQEIMQNQ